MEQLKKIFPSMRYFEELDTLPQNYRWFITQENKVIGFDNNELTNKDVELLSTFLKPHNIHLPQPSELEQLWRKRISQPIEKKVSPFRFVYFLIKSDQIDTQLFKEAIPNTYGKDVPILWENEHEGIIIEEKPAIPEESISYEQIIDVLMSDLYVNISFFVGPYIDTLSELDQYYESFVASSNIAFTYSDQSVVTYIDAISYHFVDQAEKNFLDSVKQLVLKELIEDHELLHSIKVFIQSNLNVTVASKKLHLHRNSLQYRLDKFVDKTGIDVRQFNEAMAVYLVILSMMHKE